MSAVSKRGSERIVSTSAIPFATRARIKSVGVALVVVDRGLQVTTRTRRLCHGPGIVPFIATGMTAYSRHHCLIRGAIKYRTLNGRSSLSILTVMGNSSSNTMVTVSGFTSLIAPRVFFM